MAVRRNVIKDLVPTAIAGKGGSGDLRYGVHKIIPMVGKLNTGNIVIAGEDYGVRIWNVDAREELKELKGMLFRATNLTDKYIHWVSFTQCKVTLVLSWTHV